MRRGARPGGVRTLRLRPDRRDERRLGEQHAMRPLFCLVKFGKPNFILRGKLLNPDEGRSVMMRSLVRVLGAAAFCLSVHGPASDTVGADSDPGRRSPSCQIHGRVLAPGGAVLEGASVTLEPSGRSETSATDGSYCFLDLAAGTYVLHVEAGGYQTRQTDPVEVSPGSSISLDVRLTRLYLLEDEVVTTATRTPRNLARLPIRVEVIDREQIDRVAARTLADAVEFSSGVNVESNCQNCNFSQIRMLGMDGAYCQVLVDGQPTFSSLASVYGIEHIPSRMIDRLEIVKGGGSALYGSGSVAGVINVIPKSPEETSGELETRFSWMDGHPGHSISGSVDLAHSKDLTLTLFGQTDRVKPVDLTGDGITEVSYREMQAFGIRAQKTLLHPDAKLVVDFSRTTERRRGGDRLELPEFQARIAEAVGSRRISAMASWEHRVGGALRYKLTASHADTDRDTYYGASMDPNAYGSSRNPLTVLDGQMTYEARHHELTFGAQHSIDRLEDHQPAYGRITEVSYEATGVFAQDTWRIGSRWEAIVGARVDRHSEIDPLILSPRLALKHDVARSVTVRSSISTGFRAPQVFDEDLHITQVGGDAQVIRNDPDLKEESSIASMLGIEWTPMIREWAFLVEANGFYTTIDDQFFIDETDDPNTPEQQEFSRINLGGANVYGVEANLSLNLAGRLTGDFGFVVQRSRYDSPEPDFGTKDFFRTPEQYGSFGLTWTEESLGELFLGGKYTGSMNVPHYIFDPATGEEVAAVLERSGSFVTLDASVSREVPISVNSGERLVLTLGVKNLTDAYQEDLDQGMYRDSGFVYGPRFPRSVYVSTKVRL
ncbi:MAG: TonB-dependent receptor [Candidatus Eisenbacteria bacterium]|nr:TonB-dependent receptor [Candidatus Latescibacterota bacterium]MBD3301577.1 TonB-dependent receptor [Candidatus Eisenbacteria bacterium]